MLAPSAARRFAIAAPMPREAPVTSATLPASSLSFLLLMFCPFFVFGRCLFSSIRLPDRNRENIAHVPYFLRCTGKAISSSLHGLDRGAAAVRRNDRARDVARARRS